MSELLAQNQFDTVTSDKIKANDIIYGINYRAEISRVISVTHDREKDILTVEFANGEVHNYVPEDGYVNRLRYSVHRKKRSGRSASMFC